MALIVEWTAPASVTGITSYDLRYIESAATDKSDPNNWHPPRSIWTSGELRYTLTGLANDTEYDVQIRAVTTEAGAWSATADGKPESNEPDITPGDGALTVTWEVPAAFDEADITSYDLRYIETAATDRTDGEWDQKEIWTVGDGAREYVLTDLTNGTEYDVQIRAKTNISGAWSATATGTAAEHGGTLQTATTLRLDTRMGGVITPGDDADYFKIVLSQRTQFIVFTYGDLDTVGDFLDEDGDLLGFNDDGGLSHGAKNFLITAILSAGTYYVKVTSYQNATGSYVLRAKTIPETTGTGNAQTIELNSIENSLITPRGDVDYFRIELQEETDLIIRSSGQIHDTVGELLNSRRTKIAESDDGHIQPSRQFLIRAKLAAGVYYIKVRSFPYSLASRRRVTGLYTVHVDTVSEPGDSIADATPLEFGDQVSAVLAGGRLDPSTDTDYFRIVTTKPTYVYIRAVSDSVDIDGALLNSVGTEVSADIYETTFSSSTKGFTLRTRLATGTHFIGVDIDDDMGTGPYTIQMLEDTSHSDTVTDCTAISATFGDPLSGCQWHLENTGQFSGTTGEDINVDEVWTDGNRGAGVNVVVVDNGLDYLHEDLNSNVNTGLNHDYTGLDLIYHDNSHGTNVAGIIAARDNTIGVRGVAPRATVYGYNVLRRQTGANFVNAVTRNMATTHISNNSWGALEGPGLDTVEAFWERAVESGITEGLGGKGVFYVWSAGNGADSGDNSNLEEIANFYGITAVCAVNNQGERSGYSEEGANLWVCAPSSDGSRGRITTTTNFNAYTDSFGGTSAAAPIVSGVAALIRAANSDVTWRDVKLILAASARKNDSANTGWKEGANKYGSTGKYHFNHEYGFGVVDAKAAVDLATGWTNLPEFTEETAHSTGGSLTIPDSQTAVTSVITMGSEVQFIEFVEINTAFEAPDFRDLEVELESPSGAVSTLTVPYDRGDCDLSFQRFLVSCGLTEDFRFGSAPHLGENPEGEWTLRITDKQSGGSTSRLKDWSLTVYGHRNSPGRPAITLIPGDGILTVNWDPPSNTGTTPITAYDVRYIESDATDKSDGEWTVENRTSVSRSYTIPNVTNHTKYNVQVRAVNNNGNGLWSPVSEGTPVPNTDPYFEEGDYADRLIPENSTAGTNVGLPVEAIDTDGDTLTYSLSGADARYFDFDSGTGQISVADGTVLDADTGNNYSVTVSVRDSKNVNDVADARTDDTITVDIKVEDLWTSHRLLRERPRSFTPKTAVERSVLTPEAILKAIRSKTGTSSARMPTYSTMR